MSENRMKTTIEKNKPAPPYNYRKWVTTLADTEAGGSFEIPGDDDIRRSVLSSGKRLGYKLTSRRRGNGIRVWVLEKP